MTMLRDIKIIDLTTVIFGPYATQMLADMGAEVIKVETPLIGDVSRYLGNARGEDPTMGSIHLTVNRGKQSIALDLKNPEDAEILRRLIQEADVFIHNIRSKAIERLGFDYESCRKLKPDIIYLHCTGFGQHGPYADLQAYDDVIQAATGTTTLLPRVDGVDRPRYLPSLIADKVAGLYAAQAILAALVHRLRSSEGQMVEVPMFECFTNFIMTEHLRDAAFVPPIGPAGYPRQLEPSRQPFPTADGYMAIVPYTAESTQRLLELIGSSDLLTSDAYLEAAASGDGMPVVYKEIALKTPKHTTAEWMELFAAHEIPAMPARDLEDVVNDPHLTATDFFRPKHHPDIGDYLEMQPPLRFGAMTNTDLGHAPKLDADGPAIRDRLRNNINLAS